MPAVLAWYNPAADTKLSADASAYSLGVVLLQKSTDGEWKPVAYACRSMTETEMRYAQIEKEALATHGHVNASQITCCERLSLSRQITNPLFHSSALNTWTAYPHAYYASEFTWWDTATTFYMYKGNCFTMPTPSPECLRAIQKMTRGNLTT